MVCSLSISMTRPSVDKFAAVGVLGEELLDPEFLADFVDGVELVGGGLVRAEDAEVVHVLLHHVAQEDAQRARVLRLHLCPASRT